MAWFKKGKMKGFAHPILDEDGEPTGEWCNEPKSDTDTKEKPATSTYKGRDEDKVDRRTLVMEIGEDWRAGKRKDNDPLVVAREAFLLDWANGSTKGGKDVSDKVSTEETGRGSGEEARQGSGEFDEEWWLKAIKTLGKGWIAEQLKLFDITLVEGQLLIKTIKEMEPSKRGLLKNGVELALAYKDKQ